MSGLYAMKPRFVKSLAGIEDRLIDRGVSADVLSYAAVLVSALAGCSLIAGFLVHPRWWLAVAPLALVRLALNALDGSVARRTGTARPFGQVINEIGDRISDALFIAPLAFFIPSLFVLTALIVASITSACGSLGAALGFARSTQGPMGKADRCLVVAGGSVVAGTTNVAVGPFVVALLVIIFGGVVTIVARLRSLHRMAQGASDVR